MPPATMRAPSLELLRALRSITTTTSSLPSATSSSQSHIVSRRAIHTCQRSNHSQLRSLYLSPSESCVSTPYSRRLSTTTTLRATSSNSTSITSSGNVAPSQPRTRNPYAPTTHDRGPKSTEDTQTDFGAMDVLGHIAAPATSVDACTSDGFHLDNGAKTEGGSGIMLVGGEAFSWEPWKSGSLAAGAETGTSPTISTLLDARKGIISFPQESLGLLEMVHPKPDLLIIGTGGKLWMLSQETRRYVSEVLGCRLDVVDTANAAAMYNLLAKERGIEGGAGVGALLLPLGWVGPKVAGRRR